MTLIRVFHCIMAGKYVLGCLKSVNHMQRFSMSTASKIGNREIVGFGLNGEPSYIDRLERPMPAIRFKENTPDIQVLREKEKGDWKKLSIQEKKALYRASFCQTFSEMEAPTGEWKSIAGMTLIAASAGIWLFIYFKFFVYPDLPITFDEEHRLAQLERIKILDVNPIHGFNAKK
ncbi:cytochrome c oxidase subunit 4 isoform 2, mitochondrial-like isoform X2 [Belonocnema kinseyi]|uniref:cytochrome c oxidase subunit 4 isoform 2, mitochondrial-like isoform X2 n=1 Tax=Belonocnema kinseyi TaxID=2817044 RepID=UPI00143D7382|nr:cytochrome c oxidase subunit 4 isoform 2, mitochondrial-like isoform X2 [Belonocnema kinseyi]